MSVKAFYWLYQELDTAVQAHHPALRWWGQAEAETSQIQGEPEPRGGGKRDRDRSRETERQRGQKDRDLIKNFMSLLKPQSLSPVNSPSKSLHTSQFFSNCSTNIFIRFKSPHHFLFFSKEPSVRILCQDFSYMLAFIHTYLKKLLITCFFFWQKIHHSIKLQVHFLELIPQSQCLDNQEFLLHTNLI